MIRYLLIMVLGASLFVQSCATSRIVAERGKRRIVVVETIPQAKEPKWVKSTKDFWEKKDSFFYRGVSQGYTEPEISRQDAEAVARTSLARQIKLRLREEFRRAIEAKKHDPIIGGYLSDTFVSVIDNLEVSGSVIVESYSERIWEESHKTILDDYWRSYVLVKLPKGEYDKCIKRAFQNLRKQVRANEEAKELVEETEKWFLGMEKD